MKGNMTEEEVKEVIHNWRPTVEDNLKEKIINQVEVASRNSGRRSGRVDTNLIIEIIRRA